MALGFKSGVLHPSTEHRGRSEKIDPQWVKGRKVNPTQVLSLIYSIPSQIARMLAAVTPHQRTIRRPVQEALVLQSALVQ